jgi:hypothetical protein
MNAVRAFSLMIGAFLFTKWINKTILLYLFIIQGVSIIFWAFVQFDFYMSLVAMLLVGASTTTLWSFTYALLQEHTQRAYLGRVLAYNEMLFMFCSSIRAIFVGIMVSFMSLFMITFLIGLLFIGFAFYYKKFIFAYV